MEVNGKCPSTSLILPLGFLFVTEARKKVNISGTYTWVTVFDDEMELGALLNAIGREGLQVLLAQGIDEYLIKCRAYI